MAKRAFWGTIVGGVAATALAATVALASATAQPMGGQAVSATGSTSGSTSGSTTAADRPKYCERIEKALTRRQQVQTRLAGDANTRGSIAWLQAKSQSQGTGNPELSKLLADMATLRSQVKDPAATVIADLQAVQQAHCS